MAYTKSRLTGMVINSEGIEIPQDDNTELYKKFEADISNGIDIIWVDYFESERSEILNNKIELINEDYRIKINKLTRESIIDLLFDQTPIPEQISQERLNLIAERDNKISQLGINLNEYLKP